VALAVLVQFLSEQAGVLEALAAGLEGWLEYGGIALVVVFAALWLGGMATARGRVAPQA
jgi:hypothetical protein